MNLTRVYNSMFKIAAAPVADEEAEFDLDAFIKELKAERKKRELGYGGAFVRSIPVSLLVAGLTGTAGTLLSGGNLAAGAIMGGASGVATSALNTINNAHATPEEAGTSTFAIF